MVSDIRPASIRGLGLPQFLPWQQHWCCTRRQLPIFTFVNKLDRPALEPLEIIDQLEKEFGLKSYPVNWPIGSGDRYSTDSKGTVHSLSDANWKGFRGTDIQ